MTSIGRFYRVSFADEKGLHAWAARLLEHVLTLEKAAPGALDPRPVVFVPRMPPQGSGPIFGYVNDAALKLPLGLGREAEVDGTVLPLRALPDGLTLLYGEDDDGGGVRASARSERAVSR